MTMMIDEEAQARADVWKYAFGYINPRIIKVSVELEIPDIIQKHGGSISLSGLSAAVGVPADKLYRIMRFLIHHGMFNKTKDNNDVVYYSHNPLSRLLTMDNVGPFMLMQNFPQGTSAGITVEALRTGKHPGYKTKSEDIWEDPQFAMKNFTDSMACHAKVATSAMIGNCSESFRGVGTLVDVGGRHGMALSILTKAFPWIKGSVFDLPEVVAEAPIVDGIKFIGGSMFETIPKADAIMLMWILHDWSDEVCINILTKCKEAIPANTGKVIIVEAVVNEDGEEDEHIGARLSLDMMMMDVTVKGKERTYKEWAYILNEAGFTKHKVQNIKTVVSVIEAYP